MEKLKKTICVCDISKLSLLKELFTEEQLIFHLIKFYGEIGEIIVKNNGRIIKYYGDEILFIFDDPKIAFNSSKEMIKYYSNNLSKNNEKLIVSIVTGDIYIGEIGHSSCKSIELLGVILNKLYSLKNKENEYNDGLYICEETKNNI